MQRSKLQGFSLTSDVPRVSQFKLRRKITLAGLEVKRDNRSLSSALSEEQSHHLGPINVDWFKSRCVQGRLSGTREDAEQGAVSSADEDKLPDVGILKSERRGRADENGANSKGGGVKEADGNGSFQQETPIRKHSHSHGLPNPTPPPLFTPDVGNKTAADEQGSQKSENAVKTLEFCHSTPGIESQAFSPLHKPDAAPLDRAGGSTMKLPLLGISPLHPQREETPQFLRRLLQLETPSTVNTMQESISFSVFQMTEPTPQRLSKSLGVEANCNLSWSDSMATPISVSSKATSKDTTAVNDEMNSPQTWKPIIAKVLFTSTDDPQQESKSLGTEDSSEPLQSLHLSSTEEDKESVKEGPTLEEATSQPTLEQSTSKGVKVQKNDLPQNQIKPTDLPEKSAVNLGRSPQKGEGKTETSSRKGLSASEGKKTSHISKEITGVVRWGSLCLNGTRKLLESTDVTEEMSHLRDDISKTNARMTLSTKKEKETNHFGEEKDKTLLEKAEGFRSREICMNGNSKSLEDINVMKEIQHLSDDEEEITFRSRACGKEGGDGLENGDGLEKSTPFCDGNRFGQVSPSTNPTRTEKLKSAGINNSTSFDNTKSSKQIHEEGIVNLQPNQPVTNSCEEFESPVGCTSDPEAVLRRSKQSCGSSQEDIKISGGFNIQIVDQGTVPERNGSVEESSKIEDGRSQNFSDETLMPAEDLQTAKVSKVGLVVPKVCPLEKEICPSSKAGKSTEASSEYQKETVVPESTENIEEIPISVHLRLESTIDNNWKMNVTDSKPVKHEKGKVREANNGLTEAGMSQRCMAQMEHQLIQGQVSMANVHKLKMEDVCGKEENLGDHGTSQTKSTDCPSDLGVEKGESDLKESPVLNIKNTDPTSCSNVRNSEMDTAKNYTANKVKVEEGVTQNEERLAALEQETEVEVDCESDDGEVNDMQESMEDSLYDRLALLAQTLNIPLDQMIEADKKARKLQRAAHKQKRLSNNGKKLSTIKSKTRHKSVNEKDEEIIIISSIDGMAASKQSMSVNEGKPPAVAQVNTGHKLHRGKELVTKQLSGERDSSLVEESISTKPYYKLDKDVKDNIPEESSSVVSGPPLSKEVQFSNITGDAKEGPQTQSSLNSSSGSASKDSLKPSNIEDTLAFFLATPPTVKRRLSTSKQSLDAADRKGDSPGVCKDDKEMPSSNSEINNASLASKDHETPLDSPKTPTDGSESACETAEQTTNRSTHVKRRQCNSQSLIHSPAMHLVQKVPTTSNDGAKMNSEKSGAIKQTTNDALGSLQSHSNHKDSLTTQQTSHQILSNGRTDGSKNLEDVHTTKQPSRSDLCNEKTPNKNLKTEEIITPPRQELVGSCMFSPLTPNMTEALLRVTEEVSSSLENSLGEGHQGTGSQRNNEDSREEEDLLDRSMVSMENGHNGAASSFGERNESLVYNSQVGNTTSEVVCEDRDLKSTDDEAKVSRKEEGNDLFRNNSEMMDTAETIQRSEPLRKTLTGEESPQNMKEDSLLSILHMRPKKSLTKFLYSVTGRDNESEESLPEWQQNAVLDEAFIEEEENKKGRETREAGITENLEGSRKHLLSPKYPYRPRNGQFQTFNSFYQKESEEIKAKQLGDEPDVQHPLSVHQENSSTMCNKQSSFGHRTPHYQHSSSKPAQTMDQTTPRTRRPIQMGPGGDGSNMRDHFSNHVGVNKELFSGRYQEEFSGKTGPTLRVDTTHSDQAARHTKVDIHSENAVRPEVSIPGRTFKPHEYNMDRAQATEQRGFPAHKGEQTNIGSTSALESSHKVTGVNIQNQLVAGFKSASGKEISISASAMEKAKDFMEAGEDDMNRQTSLRCGQSLSEVNVNQKFASSSTGFTSASGKKGTISTLAMEKAKHLLEVGDVDLMQDMNDTDNQLSSEENFKCTSLQEMPGFSSASGKKILISAAALEKAKHLMEVAELILPEEDDLNLPKPVVDEPPSLQNGDRVSNVSVQKDNSTKVDQVFTGFTNASGKRIQISSGALRDAEKKMLEFDSDSIGDIQNVNVVTGYSDVTSGSEQRDGVGRFHERNAIARGAIGRDPWLGKSVTPSRPAPKKFDPSKDYSHIPKGFRPFKPPGKMAGDRKSKKKGGCEKQHSKDIPAVKRDENHNVFSGEGAVEGKAATSEIQGIDGRHGLSTQKPVVQENGGVRTPKPDKRSDGDENRSMSKKTLVTVVDVLTSDSNSTGNMYENSFEAEENDTQVVQEIAAAEEAEMLYDFMRDDEEDVVDTQIDSLLTSADGVPCTNKSNTNGERNAIDAKNKCMKSNMVAAGGYKKSTLKFNALCTSSENGEVINRRQIIVPEACVSSSVPVPKKKKKVRFSDEFQVQGEEETTTKVTRIENAEFGDGLHVHNRGAVLSKNAELNCDTPGIPQNVPFLGFQTASGTKVEISKDALEKVKQMWSDNAGLEQHFGKPQVSPEKEGSVSPKDVTFCGFQTANGKKVEISKEALQKAKEMWSEVDNEHLQDFQKQEPDERNDVHELPRDVSFARFKTVSGTIVNISEDTMLQAKKMGSKDDNKMMLETHISMPGQFCEGEADALAQNVSFGGFKTASGTKVNISKEALQKAKRMWSDDATDDNECTQENGNRKKRKLMTPSTGEDENPPLMARASFFGFESAGGTKITVTASALERAKRFLSDEDDAEVTKQRKMKAGEMDLKHSSKAEVSIMENNIRSGSKTTPRQNHGGRKGLDMAPDEVSTFSDKVFHKTSCGFKTAENVSAETNCKDTGSVVSKTGLSAPKKLRASGFQTASGTGVAISEAALQRARNLFVEENPTGSTEVPFGEDLCSGHKQANKCVKNNPRRPPSGFQTASGSDVTISEESLRRAKIRFADENELELSRSSSQTAEFDQSYGENNNQIVSKTPLNSQRTSSGFQTAAGCSVTISKEALLRARNLFSDEEEIGRTVIQGAGSASGHKPEKNATTSSDSRCFKTPTADKFLDNDPAPNVPPTSGFMTGSGKLVSVSESALKEARQKWQNDMDTGSLKSILGGEDVICSSPRPGFMTGSGKNVAVSELALREACQRWQNDVSIDGNSKQNTVRKMKCSSTTVMAGFQTGSGKSVSISESALKEARQKWQNDANIDNSEQSGLGKTKCASSSVRAGFQTGSGKDVSISESALKEARQIWQNDDNVADLKKNSIDSWKNSNSTVMAGFHTGSGKGVSISESALREARQKWQKTDVHASSPTSDVYAPVPGVGDGRHLESTLSNLSTREERAKLVPGGNELTADFMLPRCATGTNSQDRRNEDNRGSYPTTSAVGSSRTSRGLSSNLMNGRMHTSQFAQKEKNGNQKMINDVLSVSSHQPIRRSPSNLLTDRGLTGSQFKPILSQIMAQDEAATRPTSSKAKIFEKVTSTRSWNPEMVDEEVDLKLVWECARLAQAKRIQGKKKLVIRPLKGNLSKLKKGGDRLVLREAVDGQLPKHHTEQELYAAGILPSVLNISAQTAAAYRFEGIEFFSQETLASPDGILLGDGGRLVLSEDGTAGGKEFASALLDTPGVDPSLVSVDWAENHYRWIVWKLASMEVAYPYHFGGRLLTPGRVLLQLKHRYEREVDQSQRSALKKILERDEAASRRMVLFVAEVITPSKADGKKPPDDCTNNNMKQLLLTDSWYAIRTVIDQPLSTLVDSGKITVGTKLCVSGAELIGSQDACSPLEIPESLALKISCNSTRRARFDARLGMQRDPRPFPVPLGSLYGNGGAIGCVDVVIARVYPMQYMEKYLDGSSVFRGQRAEERAAAEFLKTKHRTMERLYAQIQKKYEDENNNKGPGTKNVKRSRTFTQEEVSDMSTGEELFAALSSSRDPGSLQAFLTTRQMSLLQDHQRSLNERQNQGIQEEMREALAKQQQDEQFERKVVSLVKIRVTDYYGRSRADPPDSSVLTIWRPAEDLMAQLTEGKRFQITSLSASGARFKWGSSNAQLASSRSTRYLEKPIDQDILDSLYHPREVTTLCDLSGGCHQSVYGEVDVVGLVVSVTVTAGHLQKVYLADQDENLVEVKFWTGLKSHHLDDVVKPGQFITASNLQIRGSDTSTLHVTELSSFSLNPKTKFLQQAIQELKNQIKDVQDFLQQIEGAVSQLSNRSRQQPARRPVRENGFQKFIPLNGEATTPKGSHQQRGALTTPVQDSLTTPECLSARREDLERRNGLLSRLPSPPPLNRLPIGPSPLLKKEFRTPCRKSSGLGKGSIHGREDHVHASITQRSGGLVQTGENPENAMMTSERTPVSVTPSSSNPLTARTPLNARTSSARMPISARTRSSLNQKHPKEVETHGVEGEVKDVSRDISRDSLLTDTQEARMEVSELTDIEIQELQECWSQPLSYSSQDETDEGIVSGAPTERSMENEGIGSVGTEETNECKGDNSSFGVRSNGKNKKQDGKAGESSKMDHDIQVNRSEHSDEIRKNVVQTGNSTDKTSAKSKEDAGSLPGRTGVKSLSLSRRKRGRVGESPPSLKKRKLSQDSSHEAVDPETGIRGSDEKNCLDDVICIEDERENKQEDIGGARMEGDGNCKENCCGEIGALDYRCANSNSQNGRQNGKDMMDKRHQAEKETSVCHSQSVGAEEEKCMSTSVAQGNAKKGVTSRTGRAQHPHQRGHQGGGDAVVNLPQEFQESEKSQNKDSSQNREKGSSVMSEIHIGNDSRTHHHRQHRRGHQGSGNAVANLSEGNQKSRKLQNKDISENSPIRGDLQMSEKRIVCEDGSGDHCHTVGTNNVGDSDGQSVLGNKDASSMEVSNDSQLSDPQRVRCGSDGQTHQTMGCSRRKRSVRSNVNLALLDEIRLKESPEQGFSSRLRNRPRPSYKE